MAVETRHRPRRRGLIPGQIPDPLRAHGAWVYLAVSILVGVLSAVSWGPALLAGFGCVGAFLAAGALAPVGRAAAVARAVAGALLLVGSPALAVHLGADRLFLLVALIAVPPVLAASSSARADGFMSPGALSWGVTALACSAPTVASAGGASLRAALVLVVLAPFFFWRTWRLARAMGPGWTRQRFARQGLLESGLAIAWAAVAVALARLAPP